VRQDGDVHPRRRKDRQEVAVDRAAFEGLIERLGRARNVGDAPAAAACLAGVVDDADPRRHRWRSRAQLEGFFAPPPGGHHLIGTWREWQDRDDERDRGTFVRGPSG
jgi:hypothetical protein